MTETAYVEAKGGPYCKGCGHPMVLRSLAGALGSLGLPPSDIAVVTDIGCVGLADSQILTPHTVHTTHGRSTAFASGMSLADSVMGEGRLKTIVLIGDGGAMIGINHLVNAALLNPDVTVLVHNNFLFGMTGGQNSAFSPIDFVTATTRGGSFVPPLDLARVLMAARAPFVARMVTGDRDLADVIEGAIAHPGFAVVEVVELCTAYGTRWNPLTGATLRDVADEAGYELGVLRDEPRPTFGAAYRERHAGAGPAIVGENGAGATFSSTLERQIGLVIAGSAGERVQTAARVLAQAALSCGLYATQKNDYPVTVGTGFSVSEVILAPEPILYTGIELPDAVLVVSQDGVAELARAGVFERVGEGTLVLADEELELTSLAAEPVRLALRADVGGKQAALAAVAAWVERDGSIPAEALRAAVKSRLGRHAEEAAPALEALSS